MGFIVAKPLQLLNWKPLAIGPEIPLEQQSSCPACEILLSPLAALTAAAGQTLIRIGGCQNCGYVGYQDRPTREWMSRYYANIWSARATQDPRVHGPKRQKKNASALATARALGMLPDRSRPVCEIGSGYGTMLAYIRSLGCANVIGTESSRHRAAAANALGIPVLAGDFESPKIVNELAGRGPFSLIVSFHVLEHTYHPADIIGAAAGLQRPGDLLVIGVPNVLAEPAMTILLFLPHLHSFSAASLSLLLAPSL